MIKLSTLNIYPNIFTDIIEWSPQIEEILKKGHMVIKQTQHDKFITPLSLLIHGLL